jgi:hypothetical protein
MAIPGIHEIQSLALKYSKPQLAQMAQSGLIDTQKAVLAAMMRDRIAKEDMKPPTTTVAQDALGLQPPQMAQLAPQAPPTPIEPPQQASQMGMPAEAVSEEPTQMAASGGLTSLPTGDVGNYAGGGIVAFAKGGDTPYKIYTPDLKPTTVPSELTPEQAQINQEKLSTAFGINPNFYQERSAEVASQREKLGKEKNDAWIDALIMGGLGAAAGKSPFALSNIAEGGIKGYETYRGEIKDIRERDKALIESENKIKEAEYLRSIGKMDAADKLIQESKKDKRAADAANIKMENDRLTAEALAKTQAGETGFKEASATGRTAMQVNAQKEIALLPAAEQRLINQIYEQEKKKDPTVTLLDVYTKMRPSLSGLGSPTARMEMALKLEKEFNDIMQDPLLKSDFKKKNPLILNSEDYIREKMKIIEAYQGRGGAANPAAAVVPGAASGAGDVRSAADAIISGGR